MTPKLYTFTVAPLTVLPLKKALFSYGYHHKLVPGTLVTIPFSGRTLQGIILSQDILLESSMRPKWLKNIIGPEEYPPLTAYQLLLAQQVSDMTFTPLGKVLKHFIPKKAGLRKSSGETPENPLSSFSTPDDIQPILKALKKEETLFCPLSSHARSLVTLGALVQNLSKKKGQILVLVPDISTAVRLEKAWASFFPTESLVALYHTKTPGQYFQAWTEVRTGRASLIIATRHGLFAPFKNLHTVIQLDPNDEAYKQWDMSPRYQTQFVIPFLLTLWKAQFLSFAPLPPLSVLKEHSPTLPLATPEVTPEWINLKIERWKKNWNVFSLPLQEALKRTLAEGKQILLYVHQSGLESFSVCTECRTIFRCPSCGSTLKLTSSDHYQCKHCSFRSSLFPQCPNCKSIHFKSVGYGTEKVAREVSKILPGARVVIADKKHLSDHKKIGNFIDQAEKRGPDILVATASYSRFPPLSQPSLVAIIDADTLLNLPGYRKDEQFMELIERSKSLVGNTGQIFVQTFHPESDIFQKITTESSLSLLQNLLEERALLRYPPYYRALVLEIRAKKKDGDKALQATSKKLKEFIARHPKKKSMVVQLATRTERGKIKPYTLLRYQPPLAPDIAQFLTDHADTVFIDHDPLHIT